MRKLSFITLSVLILSILTSCNASEFDQASTGSYAPSEKTIQSTSTQSAANATKSISADITDNAELYDRKIIKNADCKMEVADIEQSTRSIRNTVALKGGFVGSMNLTNTHHQIHNQMVLRVPNENFEALYDALQKEAIHIDYNRINANDVTEQFVDIESRLKTKKEVQKRYDEILRKKAVTIEQVLDTEEKLRKIQEEIDAKEGRLKYLSSQVSLSTITVNLYQKIEVGEPAIAITGPTFMDDFKDSFLLGLDIIKGFILTLVAIWPFLLIIAFLIWWKGKWLRSIVKRAA